MEVTDAYQEYVERRREAGSAVKIATLTLPQADMTSLGYVIEDALAMNPKISAEDKRRWLSILRSIETAARDAS